jgi:hypothetical protein
MRRLLSGDVRVEERGVRLDSRRVRRQGRLRLRERRDLQRQPVLPERAGMGPGHFQIGETREGRIAFAAMLREHWRTFRVLGVPLATVRGASAHVLAEARRRIAYAEA